MTEQSAVRKLILIPLTRYQQLQQAQSKISSQQTLTMATNVYQKSSANSDHKEEEEEKKAKTPIRLDFSAV